jgi:hypothetical protein
MPKDGGQMISAPEDWAAQYGIHLLPDELDWLRTKSSALDVATRAAKHRLLLALRPERCPVCTFVLCERSAWDAAPPIPANAPLNGPGYTCPNCGAPLIHYQGHLAPERHLMRQQPGSEWAMVIPERRRPPGTPDPDGM